MGTGQVCTQDCYRLLIVQNYNYYNNNINLSIHSNSIPLRHHSSYGLVPVTLKPKFEKYFSRLFVGTHYHMLPPR